MNNTQDSKMQNIFRYVSAFLSGAVLGIAGFAYWALQAGVLQSGPLFQILFPIGLFVGIFVAALPFLIERMVSAFRTINGLDRNQPKFDNRITTKD